METSQQRIIIFGFAGAGKSTMANELAAHYGLRVVHPSGIMRMLLNNQAVEPDQSQHGTGFWESPEGVAFLQSRLDHDEPIDLVVDKILVQELDRGGVVMDSWNMPWLYPQGIKIYLKASLDERVRRVADRCPVPLQDVRSTVMMKDEGTRTLFQRLYGIDILNDEGVFDLIIETDAKSQSDVLREIIAFCNAK